MYGFYMQYAYDYLHDLNADIIIYGAHASDYHKYAGKDEYNIYYWLHKLKELASIVIYQMNINGSSEYNHISDIKTLIKYKNDIQTLSPTINDTIEYCYSIISHDCESFEQLFPPKIIQQDFDFIQVQDLFYYQNKMPFIVDDVIVPRGTHKNALYIYRLTNIIKDRIIKILSKY